MKCHDCDEAVIESERVAAVQCSKCGVVMHAECRMSCAATAKDFCESCYYSPARHVILKREAQRLKERLPGVGLLVYHRGDA